MAMEVEGMEKPSNNATIIMAVSGENGQRKGRMTKGAKQGEAREEVTSFRK
jgi:hypothetical protein